MSPEALSPRRTSWLAAASSTSNWPEAVLLTEIGLRVEELRINPADEVCHTWIVSPAAQHQLYPGLLQLGDRLVSRIAEQLVTMFTRADRCDDVDRLRLLSAASLNEIDSVAEIASALIAGFGLTPSVAPMVAAVLSRRGAPAQWISIENETRRLAAAAVATTTACHSGDDRKT